MSPRPPGAEPDPDDDPGHDRAGTGTGDVRPRPQTAMIVMDLDGRVIQFGAQATALFGYAEDEAVGARLSELIIPESMRTAHDKGLARYRSGSPAEAPLLNDTYDMPAVCKDGHTLRVALTVSPLRLAGTELLVGVVCRTEAARSAVPVEIALSASFYRTIVERAPLLITVATGGQTSRWRSPAAERMFGLPNYLPLTEAVARLVHPADRDAVLRLLADQTLLNTPYEVRMRGQDGRWHAISFVTADLRDHPAVDGVVFYGVDISRARAAEDRERQGSARLVTLLNSLAAGVLVEDAEHRVELANPALVEMFGLGVEPSALSAVELSGPPPAGADPVGWTTLREVTSGSGLHELAEPVNRVVDVVCTGIAVDGGTAGRLWVLHDVTELVAARRALEEHNRQLAALSSLKSEFISIVSHELRTPLATIASFTEMLSGSGELTSPDAPEAVAAVARNTDRMLVLVQDLRLLSQLETGDHAVARGAVDLADLAREIGDGIETANRVIRVRQDITDGPLIDGDEQLLRQLVHAVAGTVAACAGGDEMTLRAVPDATGWTLCATAPGGEFVTDEQLLATPLPVLDDASRQRSAALAVLIARAIAQSHGGTLRTEVRPGETATVTVRLPLSGPRGLDIAYAQP